MNANELRIGNWVKTNTQIVGTNSPEFGKITQIYMDGFSVDYHYPAKWYEPIPLTTEILEKSGFIIDEEMGVSRLFTDSFCFDYYDGCFWFKTSQIEIKYLHQLQNIIFALTFKELNIAL